VPSATSARLAFPVLLELGAAVAVAVAVAVADGDALVVFALELAFAVALAVALVAVALAVGELPLAVAVALAPAVAVVAAVPAGVVLVASGVVAAALARALKVSQPTVGRRIAALEEALGVTLFERSQTGLRITDQGLLLLPQMEALAAWHGARIHYVIGSRQIANLNVATLRRIVPHVAETDVFLCGPTFVVEQAMRSCTAMGVPAHRMHHEAFAY